MPGVNGKQVGVAWGINRVWGTADPVKHQILLESLSNFDPEPMFVDDNSFAQLWRGTAEIGDYGARTQDFSVQARLEDLDDWYAAGFGTPAVPRLLWPTEHSGATTNTWSNSTGTSTAAHKLLAMVGLPVGQASTDTDQAAMSQCANSALLMAWAINSVNVARASGVEIAPADLLTIHNVDTNAAITKAWNKAYWDALDSATQATNSLLCHTATGNPDNTDNIRLLFEHVVTLAPSLDAQLTLAAAYEVPGDDSIDRSPDDADGRGDYVLEVPSLKVRGFQLSIGNNGLIQASFPVIGSTGRYDSTVNHAADVTGAGRADFGNRMFRKNMTVRLNDVVNSALGTRPNISDELTGNAMPLTTLSLDFSRPLDQVFVVGQDTIIEPADDGFIEFPVSMEFARMNVRTANSLQNHMAAGKSYKCDVSYKGPHANPNQSRELLFEMPTLQILSWNAGVSGHGQVKPSVSLKARTPNEALTPGGPAGMKFLQPVRMTLRNTRWHKLLTDLA